MAAIRLEFRDAAAHAIRLDAYAGAAGAGEFYARCGYALRGRVVYRGNPLRYYEMLNPFTGGVPPRGSTP